MSSFRLVTAAVLSLAVAGTPVAARPYYGHGGYHHYRGGGIGLGGALLGAAIIGGIAVAASNNDRNDREYYAPAYGDNGYVNEVPPPVYGQGYAPSSGEAAGSPVDDCSRAAEQSAEGRGGRARVTGIDRVDPIEGGANVLGTLELDRGQGYPVQRMGWSCRAAYGEVTGIRLG